MELACAASGAADLAASTGAALECAEERLSRLRALNASLHGEATCCPCDAPLPPWAVEGGGKRGPPSKSELKGKEQRLENRMDRWRAWSSPSAGSSSAEGMPSAAGASAEMPEQARPNDHSPSVPTTTMPDGAVGSQVPTSASVEGGEPAAPSEEKAAVSKATEAVAAEVVLRGSLTACPL